MHHCRFAVFFIFVKSGRICEVPSLNITENYFRKFNEYYLAILSHFKPILSHFGQIVGCFGAIWISCNDTLPLFMISGLSVFLIFNCRWLVGINHEKWQRAKAADTVFWTNFEPFWLNFGLFWGHLVLL